MKTLHRASLRAYQERPFFSLPSSKLGKCIRLISSLIYCDQGKTGLGVGLYRVECREELQGTLVLRSHYSLAYISEALSMVAKSCFARCSRLHCGEARGGHPVTPSQAGHPPSARPFL